MSPRHFAQFFTPRFSPGCYPQYPDIIALRAQVVVGVVFNPINNELFTAVRGEGSRLNGKPLQVSAEDDLGSGLLTTEIGVGRDEATVEAVFDRVSRATQAVRAIRVRS